MGLLVCVWCVNPSGIGIGMSRFSGIKAAKLDLLKADGGKGGSYTPVVRTHCVVAC